MNPYDSNLHEVPPQEPRNVKNDFADTAWHTACEAGSLPVLIESMEQV